MKTIQTISAEAIAMAETLSATKLGEIITYAELNRLTKRDVRKHRGTLHTALLKVLREHKMVFHAVRGIGVKRATDYEINHGEDTFFLAVNRKARRAMKRMACIDYSLLDNTERISYNAKATGIATLAVFCSEPTQLKIRGAVTASNAQLELGTTVQMFQSNGK